MPVYSAKHGGLCCGVSHLHSFYDYVGDMEKHIKTTINRRNDPIPHMYEVVLADTQNSRARQEVLTNLGFKLVTQFKNGNSGNECYVYHLVLEKRFEKV
jgi:hypothetical protein